MLVVDTGVLVAAADLSDPAHEPCAALLASPAGPIVTTGPVECRAASDGVFWNEVRVYELPSAERRMEDLVHATRERCPELFE